jgi:hypothetical protein
MPENVVGLVVLLVVGAVIAGAVAIDAPLVAVPLVAAILVIWLGSRMAARREA